MKHGILEKRPDNQGRHCWGTGVKRAVFFRGKDYAPVDLFQVIEPRQWGVIYAIRTGPGDFNRALVTARCLGGACPPDRKVASGRVWGIGDVAANRRLTLAEIEASRFARLVERGKLPGVEMIPTPEEADFFAALRFPYLPPNERTLKAIQDYLAGLKAARRT